MSGYLCCFGNASMPNYLRIAGTYEDPRQLLREANADDDWRPPTPYRVVVAKRVDQLDETEQNLRTILTRRYGHIDDSHGFFRISTDEIRELFGLISGNEWSEGAYSLMARPRRGESEDGKSDSQEEGKW